MKKFIIETSDFLSQSIDAFYSADYVPGNWRKQGTIENMIVTLKNDITPYQPEVLEKATQQLASILFNDLPLIPKIIKKEKLTVCVVPRAKAEHTYRPEQLLFKKTIKTVIANLGIFNDGTDYIMRHTNTKTTHLRKGISGGGDGPDPYPGITKDTCTISYKVRGKDILLIDDLYTKTINVVEDAIQALLDNGANSVVFYSIGRTVEKKQYF